MFSMLFRLALRHYLAYFFGFPNDETGFYAFTFLFRFLFSELEQWSLFCCWCLESDWNMVIFATEISLLVMFFGTARRGTRRVRGGGFEEEKQTRHSLDHEHAQGIKRDCNYCSVDIF